jgi:hypothetical protein
MTEDLKKEAFRDRLKTVCPPVRPGMPLTVIARGNWRR